jgi:MoxR-like ATPase
MSNSHINLVPDSVERWQTTLADHQYIAERSLATAIYLAVKLSKPLFVEGETGVGKTEIAKVLTELRPTNFANQDLGGGGSIKHSRS